MYRGADIRHRHAPLEASVRHIPTTERPRARTREDESRVRLPVQASGAFRERWRARAAVNDAQMAAGVPLREISRSVDAHAR